MNLVYYIQHDEFNKFSVSLGDGNIRFWFIVLRLSFTIFLTGGRYPVSKCRALEKYRIFLFYVTNICWYKIFLKAVRSS